MATETAKLYENIKVTQLENSEIEIEGEIPVSVIPSYRAKALKKIGENVNIDGFRKGHIPEKVLIEKIGEDGLMNEISEMALADMYPTLVLDKNLDVIGSPQVTITKLAPGNPIGFKIKSAVIPKFDLPNYLDIAKEIMKEKDIDLEVNDDDVEKVLTEVRRGKARFEKAKKDAGEKAEDKTKEGDSEKVSEPTQEEKVSAGEEEDLPELDDAFISTLGDFKTVADFEVRVRADLGREKVQKAMEKKRITLSEKLIEKTDIKLPKILVENELNKMVAQMKDDVARMQMKFEDYLTRTKKTEEDLRVEWREQAEKRTALQLILNKIAQTEKITANKEETERQINHILEHHKDANKDNVRIYVETQLINEAVFKFLEGADKKTKGEK
jgi:trigger factor